jgi:prolyl oligopeptidase
MRPIYAKNPLIVGSILALAIGQSIMAEKEDPFLWLESVDSKEALDWAVSKNEASLSEIKSIDGFEARQEQALEIVNSDERILYGSILGEWTYNYWTELERPQGVWRRTKTEDFLNNEYDWEELLDLDVLSAESGIKWVWKGATRLNDSHSRVMVSLSDGGKDASILREFDLSTNSFVEGGFEIPEAKSRFSWLDEDHLIIGTDFGDGSLTESGYPMVIKVLKRGDSLEEAKTVYTGKYHHVFTTPFRMNDRGKGVVIIYDSVSFFESDKFLLLDSLETLKIPLPLHSTIQGIHEGQLLVKFRKSDEIAGMSIEAGTLLSFDLDDFRKTSEIASVNIVYAPNDRSSLEQVAVSKTGVFTVINENVSSTLIKWTITEGDWKQVVIDLPRNGSVQIISCNVYSDTVLVGYESFLFSDRLISIDTESLEFETIQKLPEFFDTQDLMVEQRFATSTDGTQVPYFVVHKKSIEFDGTNPTYLYGYGGFEVSMGPRYSSITGKLWLENGGVYALANIRGGGEFGPKWHQAALKENRQRAFDDFHAIAEDLIKAGITSPKHLGIGGGSNGGLLVGVALTQRPDLYNAVFCSVPLLDMLRYHELPPGASWIGEYGDPRIPEEYAYIAEYSPYQNLDEKEDYPKAFFYTSTRDDRVHPAHARKMVARMEAMGHPVLYFERIEGGHAGGANLIQYAELYALQFSYLWNELNSKSE